jgi:serine/threonine protein kinase
MTPQFPSKIDILNAMRNQVCYKSQELIGGSILQKDSRVILYSGGYASVFPFKKDNGQKIGVKCWFEDIGNPKKRMLSISAQLTKLNCPYFVKFNYHENGLLINGIFQPVVTMEWIEDPTLKEYIEKNINNPSAILKVAENFKTMIRFFHQNTIAHGDLSHGNIKVKNDGTLIVIDYDSMFVQDLNGMPDIIKGLPGYQHPSRHLNQIGNSKLDYFSELVIYLSLLVYAEYPSMWSDYYETEDFLFSKQDYLFPSESVLFKKLITSSNPQIVDLTQELINYCEQYNDITLLKPLEEVVKNQIDDIATSIIGKF